MEDLPALFAEKSSGIDVWRNSLDRLLMKRSAFKTALKKEKTSLREIDASAECLSEALQILQDVAETIQTQAHEQIASVVSRCLTAVFQEIAPEFQILFERKRGRTEARLIFIEDDHEISPRSGVGGGIQDVASFALRLACLMLRRPRSRKILIMDEPFKFVHSPEYRERIRKLLETLAEEADFQFVISTGYAEYEAGTVINVEK